MKSFFVVLFIVCLSSVAFSQTPMSIGGQVGLNLAGLSIDPLQAGVSSGTRTTFGIGGVLEIGVNEMFFIQPELTYLMGGAKYTYTGGETDQNYDVLSIPVLVKAKFGTGEIKPYVFAGPELGFTMKSEQTVGTTTTDIKSNTASTNFSLDFGGGAEYKLNPSTGLFADLRYSLGLSNLNNVSGSATTVKTTGIQFFVGVKFGI